MMAVPSRSEQLFERATRVMPGGNTRVTVHAEPFPPYAAFGKGCVVVDVDGNERLDFVNNHTSLIHGHAHPVIVDAITRQLPFGTAYSMPTEFEIELAEIITERLPAVVHIRFTNSGTEAVMMAVKAARAYTNRPKIAKFEGAFHGTYDYVEASVNPTPTNWGPAGAPTPIPSARGTPTGVLDDVVVLPFNDVEACERLIGQYAGELAAVLVDPVSSLIACTLIDTQLIKRLRELTRREGILLVFDEVSAFRLGYHGAHGTLDVDPDLVCLGKMIGGGLPVGAVGGSVQVMSVFDPRGGGPLVPHSGTFNGNRATMAGGKAALDLWTPAEVERLNCMAERLKKEANAAFERAAVPGQVTGAGSVFRIHMHNRPLTDYRSALASPAERQACARLRQYLLDHGIFITTVGMGCLSTAMSDEVIDTFLEVFQAGLQVEAATGRRESHG